MLFKASQGLPTQRPIEVKRRREEKVPLTNVDPTSTRRRMWSTNLSDFYFNSPESGSCGLDLINKGDLPSLWTSKHSPAHPSIPACLLSSSHSISQSFDPSIHTFPKADPSSFTSWQLLFTEIISAYATFLPRAQSRLIGWQCINKGT